MKGFTQREKRGVMIALCFLVFLGFSGRLVADELTVEQLQEMEHLAQELGDESWEVRKDASEKFAQSYIEECRYPGIRSWLKERLEGEKDLEIKTRLEKLLSAAEEECRSLMEFVWIPAGEFMMGSPEGKVGRWNNEELHCVEITKGFEIAKTEVTQLQWFLVMGNNPSYYSEQIYCRGEHRVINDLNGKAISLCPDHPVESFSWDDVQVFLGKLNAKKASEGYTYRLPTEAEWEYAARGRMASGEVQQGAYTFGDDQTLLGDYVVSYKHVGPLFPRAVGQKKANSYGLYDIHGNISELCQDQYNEDYNQSGKREKLSSGNEGFKDPQGPASGPYSVVRGGRVGCDPRELRLASRGGVFLVGGANEVGFRPVRVSAPDKEGNE